MQQLMMQKRGQWLKLTGNGWQLSRCRGEGEWERSVGLKKISNEEAFQWVRESRIITASVNDGQNTLSGTKICYVTYLKAG